MDTYSIIILVAGILFSLAGIAGLIYPLIPGPVTLLIGLVLITWAEDFAFVGGWTITVLSILTVIAHVLDFIASALGAKKFGASNRAVLGAALGTFAGLFLGLPGLILGPFVGAVIGQLTVKNDINQASIAGIGAWLGFILGLVVKLSIGMSMVGIFLFMRFQHLVL